MACLQLQGVSHLHQYVRFSRCTNHTAAFSVRTYFRGNMWRKLSNDLSCNTLGRAGMDLKTTSGDKWHLNCCCVGLAPRCRSVPGQVMNVFSFDLLMHDSNGQRMRQLSWDVKRLSPTDCWIWRICYVGWVMFGVIQMTINMMKFLGTWHSSAWISYLSF